MSKNQYKVAFTLAEVLITLGIIGVVATITLPSLIANYKNKELAVRAKKTYSVISQAIKKFEADNSSPGDVTGLFDTSKTSAEVTKNFSDYFEIINYCSSSSKCPAYRYKVLYSSPLYDENNSAKAGEIAPPLFILKDGSIIKVVQYRSCIRTETYPQYNPDGTLATDADGNTITYTATPQYCASINFDTNGLRGPNQFGADVFEVRYRADGKTEGWTRSGYNSLLKILQGEMPEYTKYSEGDSKN